jgi:hypothetical protein
MPGGFKPEVDKTGCSINQVNKKAARREAELLKAGTRRLAPAGKISPYLDFVVVELEPLIPLVFEPLVCPGA